MKAKVHPTAIIEAGAQVAASAQVWHYCHVREGAVLGELVSLGRDVYVDKDVALGRGTRVQNGVSIYFGVHVGQWCFIGPHVIFTNDPYPRVGKRGWTPVETHLASGMSIGAGAIVLCGTKIGPFALVGAGAVVTKDVPGFTLVMGLPAEPSAQICACGETQAPLGEKRVLAGLVRDCCRKNLEPEVLALALDEAARICGA